MTIVTDVDAEFAHLSIENGTTEIAWFEEELLIEARDLRDVHLAKLTEVLAVGVDDGSRVVIDASHLLLIDRHYHHHAVLLRQLLHLLRRRAIRDALCAAIPLLVLARAEIRLGEDLLETQDLHALLRRFSDQRYMSLEHQVAYLAGLHGGVTLKAHLDETRGDLRHAQLPVRLGLLMRK